MNRRQLSSGQKALVLIVVIGTIVISLIGFVGSYDAVLKLAQRNGFGWFSYLLPIGIDVGITVFLALDLLLTWMRIPLPILRQLAWVLTGATIVFNAASAWPRPLASGMHGVVPLLFVAAIEAARHTVGRLAQIEANQLFERTRLGRWIFAPIATMRLFRRRMLWELRSYEEALEHERRRLVYRARLRASYGRLWRYKAPVDMILLLKLANLGEALPEFKLDVVPVLPGTATISLPATEAGVKALLPQPREEQPLSNAAPAPAAAPEAHSDVSGLPEAQPAPGAALAEQPAPAPAPAAAPVQAVVEVTPTPATMPEQQVEQAVPAAEPTPLVEAAPQLPDTSVFAPQHSSGAAQTSPAPSQGSAVDQYRLAFNDYTQRHGAFPDGEQLAKWLFEQYGITGRSGEALSPGHLRRYLPRFKSAWDADQEALLNTPQ
ncbi:DUF2637 domain-containing protein [Streptacidiphilus anmyonensis]|uniref:DUF2637 domain-containing protein n=1 Tax=Streptacidiphilus anmyonensis TaxID=405782 RepID=UPI0005A89A22|nr:DUF2637 domain-containing protein [Streptacidiphilus anmyonensis]